MSPLVQLFIHRKSSVHCFGVEAILLTVEIILLERPEFYMSLFYFVRSVWPFLVVFVRGCSCSCGEFLQLVKLLCYCFEAAAELLSN